jgi:formyltetrahydrofolate deformylase
VRARCRKNGAERATAAHSTKGGWQDARVPAYILTLKCDDQTGLVHAVSGALLKEGANIVEQAQFTDPVSNQFFLRTRFETDVDDVDALNASIGEAVAFMQPEFHVWPEHRKQRVLIMVSQQDHCLIDLLYRMDIGELPIDVPVIVSNHESCAPIAERHGIDFVYLPITPQTKAAQEAKLLALVDDYGIDLIVLARYMQILSDQVCRAMPGRIINIHHSFLPGFKGANPYLQAYDRGVKLIGATAHFVTADLDEGPIIDQDVQRVSHSRSPEQLAAIGRDTERLVLARAVRHAAEHRIFINDHRTVVFD